MTHLQIRQLDRHGAGHFNASRGSRAHKGVDIVTVPGESWLSLCDGKVTKLGYPYGDDLSLRYVEVTTSTGERWRYFYVKPLVGLKVGQVVKKGGAIGTTQSLQHRYPKITEHVHFEIIGKEGFIDPTQYVAN